ncbi:hypothetical protein SRHO_G00112830 [Serrasalmus rhombeus]
MLTLRTEDGNPSYPCHQPRCPCKTPTGCTGDDIPAPSHELCLGKLVVLYGQYENAPFRWLVANNVGYMKYIIDKHRSENIQRASHLAIEELKGHAGLDENGVSLFKTPEAIDETWAAQQ